MILRWLFLCGLTLSACNTEPPPEETGPVPCRHGVFCDPGFTCINGLCETLTNPTDAGTATSSDPSIFDAGKTATINSNDAGVQSSEVFELCRTLVGTWNIQIASDGEATCGQQPATQPYEVFINDSDELEAKWDTTAGADEYTFESEFLIVDGQCALKNDTVFIIHAPAMNDMPATDIKVEYHYTAVADGLSLLGSGTMHNSTTVVETGEAQQDCVQPILVGGEVVVAEP